ncbi:MULTISPECIES: NAD(P)/FAD-dependent oxidoreductase [unclassified Streptomyces]|uniref:NAD(P)/FAD-dependent oxidoreductase n=1 Tax=unclassified Streptomyces TaxID=2593676 RepID=UPI000F6D1B03|nr:MULTISPECIES: tryptophan 7-halogenase [unclassified Streptomyces]AZM58314.1 pyridine nucleotide-disulfide oxidoreductase [Streptomyces sp. WAC 01438]RSM88822.1 pyridine nucleotide-disulfide oxidoreductase [Streptomyces sp. WAC 01420]
MSASPRRAPVRAVVIGGSIAGMLAAAALKGHVDSVEIIEAHELPEGPAPRTGVPQAVHIHFLQTGGAEAVEALLPGTIDLLLAAGAHRIPVTTSMVIHAPEGWYRRWKRTTHFVITASRDLTDSVVRAQVLKDPRVGVRTHSRAVALLGGRGRVTGVRVRDTDGTEREVGADLVIDASGRASRMPQWLTRLGITGLAEDQVDSGLAYASRFYRAPVPTAGWPVIGIQADPRLPRPANAGGILPVEGNRWHVSLMGAPGAHPTADPDAFEAYARTLRHPVMADLLQHAEPLTDVSVTHGTANRRHYYERLTPWPEGLVVLGDAVASFNPLYGQGMSAAAQGAVALRELCAAGPAPGFARRAQRAIAKPVDAAWALAVGTDIHFATTTGRTANVADRLLHRYVSRLSRTATGSFHAATALTDVLALRAAPTSLVRPGVLLTALVGPLRPQLDGPQFTPAERKLLRDLEEAGAAGE